ncbi:hypothetical protein AAG570_004699 [Ranatra chinensis]|uniref:Uncharacterized protein n=1 Tax=Ranatra chinensis TaxID=642074 RepID=A0ABD0YG80_9HEMI
MSSLYNLVDAGARVVGRWPRLPARRRRPLAPHRPTTRAHWLPTARHATPTARYLKPTDNLFTLIVELNPTRGGGRPPSGTPGGAADHSVLRRTSDRRPALSTTDTGRTEKRLSGKKTRRRFETLDVSRNV